MAARSKDKKNIGSVLFKQDEKKQVWTKEVYDSFAFMQDEVMGKDHREFNDRTLKQFIDDSQKRSNSYTPSREAQGKEDYQANVFTGTTRNKVRAYAGSMAKEPPQIRIAAFNDKNERSVERGLVASKLVRHSYMKQNPALEILNDSWDCAIDGTIVKYDGYQLVKGKVEVVKSFDYTTGEVKTKEESAVIEDHHFEETIPLVNFFVRDPFEPDVQKQPEIIWVRYMEYEDFMYEYGKYPDAKHVETRLTTTAQTNDVTTFFGRKLMDRIEENKVEVLLYYRKLKKASDDDKGVDVMKSCHRIVANGIGLFDGPLLWGRKRKKYPFSKSIFEPFANRRFFWGNSLPNILMPHQDTENKLVNSMLDKTTRSLETPLLVSMDNKTALELEDQYITGDSHIYVNDVNGVKPLPAKEISQGELSMLKDVASRLSLASVDALQEGFSKSGSTAREIVISNEKSSEIKGIFYLLLTDLWLQKTRLRVQAVITHYGRVGNRFNVADEELSTGKSGSLEIRVEKPEEISQLNQTRGVRENGMPFNELDIFEEEQAMQGRPVEVIVVPPSYLDDWEFEIEIMSETLHQKARSLDMALETEKVTMAANFFPEIFMANKSKFFERSMTLFGDDARRYEMPEPPPPVPPEMVGAEGGPGAGALAGIPGASPGEVTSQIMAPSKSLGALSGTQGV